MPASSTSRTRAYRSRCKEKGVPSYDREKHHAYKKRYKNFHRADRAFVGCDGEGCGTDALGRQLYTLFRMGERELFRDGAHLGTEELLDFICDEPGGTILVGFAFGYDVTMILRDLPAKQAAKLFEKKEFGPGLSRYVWFKNFNIEYLSRQYFKVCRVEIERGEDGTEKRKVIKGSTRIIYETFGFFQKSFVKVIEEFDIGTREQRDSIAADKARRSSFTEISDKERSYCFLECVFLAELMEKLREYCTAAGIIPRTWNGAGKLAGALHRLHETPTRADVNAVLPPGLSDFANMAYYGGRFEISRTGAIKERVYEYDIRSAYPAPMRDLPCLLHGEWIEVDSRGITAFARDNPNGFFVAACSYKASGAEHFGGLPCRSREGHLYWPLQGAGIYWSCEIASAKRLGFDIRFKSGWIYKKHCECRPFDWVEALYEYRKSIGGAGPGYPIKLGINSLYGLLAQRVGAGKFTNMIWAGLITAMTRARLNDAIALDPGNIVMVATDAVYSLRPLSLPVNDRLGGWERTDLDGLFIVQPGLYWCPALRKKKSRGLSGKFFEGRGLTEKFEREWKYYHAKENSKILSDFPNVSVPVPGFIGLKLALARGKPELAGSWVSDSRLISFDYRNKRQCHSWINEHIITKPKLGHPGLASLPHREFLAAGGQEPWEMARLMLEEQPDYVDLGIPFKD